MNLSRLYFVGFMLLLAGVVLLFVGAAGSSSTSFGAVVFIGPFPIAFGSGPGAGALIVIGVLISIAMLVIFFLSFVVGRRIASTSEKILYV
jgi:uncharacterized membrane protein